MVDSAHALALRVDELNGTWVASRGETIVIYGDLLLINGIPATMGFKLDNAVVVGFSIYFLKNVVRGAKVEEVVWQSKFSEYDQQRWTRVDRQEIDKRNAHMKANLLQTAAIAGGASFDNLSDAEAVLRLNALIKEWAAGPLVKVRSCDVCPDSANRSHTGLAVEHVHYIATSIRCEGFKDRAAGGPDVHDVPVLVLEKATSKLGAEAIEKWRTAVREQPAFPPFLLDGKAEVYCSLGSGHFSQALNLFRVQGRSLWSKERYAVKQDSLRRALDDGIPSIVLSSEIPAGDRSFVAEMLNQTHGRKWRCNEDGKVEIEDGEAAQASQFVALSKVLDATELGILVRAKMGVEEVAMSGDSNWHQLEGEFAHLAANSTGPGVSDNRARGGASAGVQKDDVGCCGLKHLCLRMGCLR
eukprot:TRINITY_DN76121_c0_g1_i1.p1 TRINITY_DN76121_c0_g1~~TRINITY_DN76121_c0_g1_i1.p1  ORF type:complete len:413 (-),score=61.33 TRINITY_DN76121_c0_g1_i1:106-1344(-)